MNRERWHAHPADEDPPTAQHVLDATLLVLVFVVLFIVVCLPPPGAAR